LGVRGHVVCVGVEGELVFADVFLKLECHLADQLVVGFEFLLVHQDAHRLAP
jgi:hypothetical protein